MPILLTTLSKFRSIPWIDGVVRAIINVIVSVYELYIRHAGIENLVSITTIVDFKFDVLPVVHDFVAYESGYSPDVVVTKMNVIIPVSSQHFPVWPISGSGYLRVQTLWYLSQC